MTTNPEAIEAVARAMAGYFGPEFDDLPKNKQDWVKRRGGEPYQDVNAPRQDDLLEAAQAAIDAAKPFIEKALLKRIADWERERCNNSPSEMLADVYARDLGYSEIGETKEEGAAR